METLTYSLWCWVLRCWKSKPMSYYASQIIVCVWRDWDLTECETEVLRVGPVGWVGIGLDRDWRFFMYNFFTGTLHTFQIKMMVVHKSEHEMNRGKLASVKACTCTRQKFWGLGWWGGWVLGQTETDGFYVVFLYRYVTHLPHKNDGCS